MSSMNAEGMPPSSTIHRPTSGGGRTHTLPPLAAVKTEIRHRPHAKEVRLSAHCSKSLLAPSPADTFAATTKDLNSTTAPPWRPLSSHIGIALRDIVDKKRDPVHPS